MNGILKMSSFLFPLITNVAVKPLALAMGI